ncbi:unnamed protein product [Gongylonema pulchrum]|uniref:Methyltransf_25 domain-containing protein n=1 Tax=Gongylonema pulchrum TaxID=637853 RepID=A0A183DP52_9BILA|nr:unnamed protein product [Gongylonema pulchrum]
MHDTERNQKYEHGLKSVISEVPDAPNYFLAFKVELKAKGEEVHVIDIGTGTGLLSMMAARAGAERVTALEMFKPMSVCAEKVFHQNGYEDCIRLIASRSTDVIDEVSDEDKGNVIVAEVFDTELIGEGALRTFKEAHQTLAKDGPSITYYETAFKTFEAQSSGTFEALIMWWDLDMDGTGRCMLTTAPKWLEEEAHWRDHWMQAVYYLPESVPVHQGQQIILQCSHDEFSFWFAAQQSAE